MSGGGPRATRNPVYRLASSGTWADRLADRPLNEPARSRLPADHPGRELILAAHDAALREDQAGYSDPATGLFVLTSGYLAERGFCCLQGCRHCPYIED